MGVSLPELSHLQIAVLDAIGPREVTGRELRDRLKQRGISKSGPAFYQLMSRLEDAKFAEGWYDEKIVSGQRIKERCYRLTGLGEKAMRESANFYSPIFSRHELA